MKYVLLSLVLLISWSITHYIVPQTDIVRAIGVDTKRVDRDGNTSAGTTPSTRDVYFIRTEKIDSKSSKVYRNEDNFFYFKWDSADVQTRAESLAADKELVAVRHYGWRIPFFSVFPNAIGIKSAKEGQSGTPYLFYITLTVVWGGIFWIYRKITRFTRGRAERREAEHEAEHKTQDNDRPGGNSDLSDFLDND